jgi:hypothetical protein
MAQEGLYMPYYLHVTNTGERQILEAPDDADALAQGRRISPRHYHNGAGGSTPFGADEGADLPLYRLERSAGDPRMFDAIPISRAAKMRGAVGPIVGPPPDAPRSRTKAPLAESAATVEETQSAAPPADTATSDTATSSAGAEASAVLS